MHGPKNNNFEDSIGNILKFLILIFKLILQKNLLFLISTFIT